MSAMVSMWLGEEELVVSFIRGVRSEGERIPNQVVRSRAEAVSMKATGRWTVAGWMGWLGCVSGVEYLEEWSKMVCNPVGQYE